MQLSIVKKYWYLGAYALAALVVAFVMSLSLSYFAHADTASGTTSISGVTASTTDTGATITWTTDTPQTSQVEYGTTTSYGIYSALNPATTTAHSVALSGLTPNTTYHFIALSTDDSDNATSSPDMTFTTASSTPTTTPSGPNISGVLTSPTDTGATITWNTDVNASGGIVNYGTTSGNYTASSTETTPAGTSHSVTLTGLTPNTTYYFTVSSTNASSTSSTSPEMSFTTTNTASSTPAGPTISGITVTPTDTTALIQWLTDQPSNSQIMYGTSSGNYTASTTDNSMVINHMETLTGLTPNTTYYFTVSSTNASSTSSTSPESNFATSMSSSTGTSTSPDLQYLQNQINSLQDQINSLKQQITTLFALIGNNGNNGGNGTTTPPVQSSASIDQNGETIQAGNSVDFGGRGFGKEEHVNVMLNGQKVGEAFTNTAGSFSTGSMSVPGAPGTTQTYTFVGQNSGITATAAIHLH